MKPRMKNNASWEILVLSYQFLVCYLNWKVKIWFFVIFALLLSILFTAAWCSNLDTI